VSISTFDVTISLIF